MAGYRLSLPEVDVLAQTLDVNVRQFPLQIPSFGGFQQDRERMARDVFLDLDRRGLIRGGDLDPQLTRALRTLSDYVVTVAVMGTVETSRKLYARAAAAGETGVLAVKEGESLRLELIRPTALAVTLVGLLPDMAAGPGQSVTITQPGPRRPGEGEQTLLAPVYANRTANDQGMRIAAGYLNRPRTGTGMFTVSGRDRRVGKERQGGHVSWIDTDAGRYLAVVRPPGDDGHVRSTFSPADKNRMAQQIGELISAVAP